jgi:diaminohydroxyphosphoribosylaminopyrimidine deaminase/5-amino-6-(5-phosphoribosylamino)uracil reductase
MAFAIALAFRGWAHVKSNPMVGCVALDKEAKLVSFGYHEKYGQGHAEVNALQGIEKEALKDGKLFVTLEPCSHFGKTPPCSDLVKSYPLKKLVVGNMDPNPLVSGKGIDQIKDAGIEVEIYEGELESELNFLNEIFFHQMQKQEAFFSVKFASSLDGAIALQNGESKWISNEKSRDEVQRLRAGYKALAFGAQTLVRDNPRFNVRLPEFEGQEKDILIFCRNMDFSRFKNKQLFEIHKKENIHWLTTGEHLREASFEGMKLLSLDWTKESIASDLKSYIYKNWGITSVFCEPGSQLFDLLYKHEVIDRFYQFVSPVLLGQDSLRVTDKLKIETMKEAPRFHLQKRKNFGDDSLLIYKNK